jgi:hypothetical protein
MASIYHEGGKNYQWDMHVGTISIVNCIKSEPCTEQTGEDK